MKKLLLTVNQEKILNKFSDKRKKAFIMLCKGYTLKQTGISLGYCNGGMLYQILESIIRTYYLPHDLKIWKNYSNEILENMEKTEKFNNDFDKKYKEWISQWEKENEEFKKTLHHFPKDKYGR